MFSHWSSGDSLECRLQREDSQPGAAESDSSCISKDMIYTVFRGTAEVASLNYLEVRSPYEECFI